MKKLIALALVMMLTLTLAACGGNSNTPDFNGMSTPPATSDGNETPTTPTREPDTMPSSSITSTPDPGETSPAAFEENGYPGAMMVAGTAYDCAEFDPADPSSSETCKVTITDYKVVESHVERYNVYEAKEGYEWRIVRYQVEDIVDISQSGGELDENSLMDSLQMAVCVPVDWYSGERIETYPNQDVLPNLNGAVGFSVNHLGKPYECVVVNGRIATDVSETTGKMTDTIETAYFAPIGYDGVVLAVFAVGAKNAANSSLIEDFSVILNDPDTLFFRLAN